MVKNVVIVTGQIENLKFHDIKTKNVRKTKFGNEEFLSNTRIKEPENDWIRGKNTLKLVSYDLITSFCCQTFGFSLKLAISLLLDTIKCGHTSLTK